MRSPPHALLVDYGGVLTERMDVVQGRFCKRWGIDRESLSEVLDEWLRQPDTGSPVAALERGELEVAEFEHLLAVRLRRADGDPVAAAGLLRNMLGDGKLDELTLSMLADLRMAGVRTALVSNAWGSDYPFKRLHQYFDRLVFSNQIGFRKPEPAIYLHSARLLGVQPGSCVFVDDRLVNVTGAIQVGMNGFHFTDPPVDRQRLRHLFTGWTV